MRSEENTNEIKLKSSHSYPLDKTLLKTLLKDRSSNKNIIWATDAYSWRGSGYGLQDYVSVKAINGLFGNVIKPRAQKSPQELRQRIKNKADVVTPTWICNRQNNLIDNAWFGRENVFNEETDCGWTANTDKVSFTDDYGKTWQDYVKANRLEITCGEAPYLVSRCDTVSGEWIDVNNRVGLLDRKLRVVGENTFNEQEWTKWAVEAYKSVYGFEWQGDSLFIARENLLFTFIDYYADKFKCYPSSDCLEEIAKIISWNVWQMDGLKFVVPESCKPRKNPQESLFDEENASAPYCEGCAKNDTSKHAGIYCKIKNWKTRKTVKAVSIVCLAADGVNSIEFDAIVGNPPYQIKDGGAQASAMPQYNLFVDFAKKVECRYVSMIIPARWYAGGKGLDSFRESMLSDTKISKLVDYPNSADCFPSLGDRNIKGGVCYFLRDGEYDGKCLITSFVGSRIKDVSLRYLKEDGCEIFIRDSLGIDIINKVRNKNEKPFSSIVSPRRPFGLATNFADFNDERTDGNESVIYALRKVGFVDRNKILRNADWIDEYKLFVPEAIGNADAAADVVKTVWGEKGTCCTETYLVIGPFKTKEAALNCQSYVNTKFFHFLLSIKKITQHTTQKCYEFVPLQDFSQSWDDKKLYNKYGLTKEEIDYVENTVWQKEKKQYDLR